MNLALWFASIGKKVLYVSLADQNWKDFVVRLGSIAFGISFSEAYSNIKEVYDNLVKITGSNLEVSVNTAGTVTVDQIIDHTIETGAEILMIDYDGCLGLDNTGRAFDDSMYNAFGDVYNKLTKLTVGNETGVGNGPQRLVFVLSQPKVSSWGNSTSTNLISLGDLAESSKKAQIIDGCINISRVSPYSCPHQLYDIRLTKARRGKVGTHATYYRNQARFIEIPQGLAEQLKMETEEHEYTDQQILAMAERYKQQEQNIQQSIKQEQKQRHDNPFT